jgi:cell division protein ZapD
MVCGVSRQILMVDHVLRYDFPTNEKVRMFLRLSELFTQLEYLAEQDTKHCHHAALHKYFDIQNATQRGDQKNDIIQELERYRVSLTSLIGNDAVDQASLDHTLKAIRTSVCDLNQIGIRISHLSSRNEFLKSLEQRSAIAAGWCEFDLPQFHYWLNLPPETRKAMLADWIQPMKVYHTAVDLILEILRGSCTRYDNLMAKKGAFEQVNDGKNIPLVQIWVDQSLGFVPKLSANKYMLSLRFIPANFDARAPIPDVIPFSLGLCSI